jgi:hypothetical protein
MDLIMENDVALSSRNGSHPVIHHRSFIWDARTPRGTRTLLRDVSCYYIYFLNEELLERKIAAAV